MSEIQVISSTKEISAKETKKVTTKENILNQMMHNKSSIPLTKQKKKKTPVYAFKIPEFCKECREFCSNLKFHNKAVHGATCELCLSVFENQEKLDKHHKQWHKRWLMKQDQKKKKNEETGEFMTSGEGQAHLIVAEKLRPLPFLDSILARGGNFLRFFASF